jgi:hypothetical protein
VIRRFAGRTSTIETSKLGRRDFATTLVYADYAPSDQEREWVEAAFARGRLVPPVVPRVEKSDLPRGRRKPSLSTPVRSVQYLTEYHG